MHKPFGEGIGASGSAEWVKDQCWWEAVKILPSSMMVASIGIMLLLDFVRFAFEPMEPVDDLVMFRAPFPPAMTGFPIPSLV